MWGGRGLLLHKASSGSLGHATGHKPTRMTSQCYMCTTESIDYPRSLNVYLAELIEPLLITVHVGGTGNKVEKLKFDRKLIGY